MAKTAGRNVEILLVEDNPGDVLLTREALEGAKVLNHLHVVEDGEEALAFLRREGDYQHKPRPDLIMLDLNLPRMNGREVLSEIKSDADFCTIPVVVLTTSKSEQDVMKSYELHANCYIVKPVDLQQFIDIIRSIEIFWFSIVKLPSM